MEHRIEVTGIESENSNVPIIKNMKNPRRSKNKYNFIRKYGCIDISKVRTTVWLYILLSFLTVLSFSIITLFIFRIEPYPYLPSSD